MINIAVFEKTVENVRKHRNIKLFTTKREIKYLVPEPNFYITTFFTENSLAIEMKKKEILLNKTVYLGLSILELSKILTH